MYFMISSISSISQYKPYAFKSTPVVQQPLNVESSTEPAVTEKKSFGTWLKEDVLMSWSMLGVILMGMVFGFRGFIVSLVAKLGYDAFVKK